MKRFEDLLSPVSWLVTYVGFLPLFLLLFQPTAWEFFVFFTVDYCTLIITRVIDARLYVRFHPGAAGFFPKLDRSRLQGLSGDRQAALLSEMARFPADRALYAVLVSFVKVIPANLVIIFYWHHTVSYKTQALVALVNDLVMFSYLYGAIFIENHAFLSRQIEECHRELDWSEGFRRLELPATRWEYEAHEAISGIAIWIFMIGLVYLVIHTDSLQSRTLLSARLLMVGTSGLLLMSRIWYLGRKYFAGGLASLFEAINRFSPESFNEILPLHSLPLLARFERSFNTLIDRLRSYKQELGRWISIQSEESRFRALGEVSALIVHDLSAPLHVLRFCSEELRADPRRAADPRYLDQLTTSSQRALELIDSMKAHLRQPQGEEAACRFGEAYRASLRLLESQYFSRGFRRIDFRCDERLEPARVAIALPDLIHVLVNLVGNSVANLLSTDHATPCVEIGIDSLGEREIIITLRDNGTGMTARRFEQVTAFSISAIQWEGGRPGLGLRLVRRLVERYEGSLTVKDLPPGVPGTLQLLKIGLA